MRWLKLAAGSAAVYVVVAACSGGGATRQGFAPADATVGAVADTGAAGAQGASGMGGAVADVVSAGSPGFLDAAIDAVTDPVHDAVAQPSGAMVVTAPCDALGPTGTTIWAEAEFPGKTVFDLVTAVGLVESDQSTVLGGYTHITTTVLVRDGWAAINCGDPRFSPPSSATIVLP